MAGKEVLREEGSNLHPLIKLVNSLGLPQAISNSAVGAVHRLVTGLVDYPAAWLQRASQGVKDGTRARTLTSDALAQAAAASIGQDPALAERAIAAWLPEAIRKQSNREAVAAKAVEHIQQSATEESEERVEKIDDDWMNVFVRYAEDASSDRARDLWAKVLSGEIRAPGAYSLSTLRFLSELDAKTARVFTDMVKMGVGNFIPKPQPFERNALVDALLLEEKGLITGVSGNLSKMITLNEDGIGYLAGVEFGLIVKGTSQARINISALILTSVGLEILPITERRREDIILRDIVKTLNKSNVEIIDLVNVVKIDDKYQFQYAERLWSADGGATAG